MHDESPGGIACKDRTLAFWTDPNNFNNSEKNVEKSSNAEKFGVGFLIGTLIARFINS